MNDKLSKTMKSYVFSAGTIVGLAILSMIPESSASSALNEGRKSDYVIVQSATTMADAKWKRVVEALRKRHKDLNPLVMTYENGPAEILSELSDIHPRFTCFVAPRQEVTREFVETVHILTRQLDDDPYTDTFWGILTGYDASNALRIARTDEPLTIDKVLSGTELAMDKVVEGYWYCELEAGRYVHKARGSEAETLEGPADSTKALVDALNDYGPDLVVTSGHATTRNWEIGFSYPNGIFRSEKGMMFGVDLERKPHRINSPNTKVYLAVGNCYMGLIDDQDAMALAWMNSVGVTQMVGYTVPTWFGYGGWGCLDYFVEQPGRYTLTEAFFANQKALIHSIETESGDLRGLNFDLNTVAFYGDPAWEARMSQGELNYLQKLEKDGDTYTFTITPNKGEKSFEPVNTNGSQRGWRPILQYFPHKIGSVEIIEGANLNPVITDDFILVPNPQKCNPDHEYRIVFRHINDDRI